MGQRRCFCGTVLGWDKCPVPQLGDEPVGDVDVRFAFLWRGCGFEVVGHCDAKPWEFRSLFLPFLIAVNIGEGDNSALLEDIEFVSELGLASGGEPDVFGHQSRADDCCLF